MKCKKCKKEFDGNVCPDCGENHTNPNKYTDVKKKILKINNYVK